MLKKYKNNLKDKAYQKKLLEACDEVKDMTPFNQPRKNFYMAEQNRDLENYFILKQALSEHFKSKSKENQ